MMTASFERSQLGALTKLGGGGQGDVYHAPKARINFAASVAFKEYKPAWRVSVDFVALEAMATFLGGRSFDEGSEIVARVAWPTKVVTDAGLPVGFLMPEVADEFRISVRLPSGKQDRPLAGLQLLLNSDDFLRRRGIAITERDRYLLLAEIAESLALLHRYDIAVGDLSPKNVLFSLTPSPRCFFVDADAMRLAGRSALPQAETPDWEIASVSSEPLATTASDACKLGLFVLRLLAGDQSTRDPSALPGSVPSAVRQLIVGALVASSASRPSAADWLVPLRTAAAGAKATVPAQPATPPAPRPQAVLPVVARSQPSPAPTLPTPRPATIPTVPYAGLSYRASQPSRTGRRLALGRFAAAGVAVVLIAAVVIPNLGHSSGAVDIQNQSPSTEPTGVPTAPPMPQHFDLTMHLGDTTTVATVAEGETVTITASGKWCAHTYSYSEVTGTVCGGPEGIPSLPDSGYVYVIVSGSGAPVGALVAVENGGTWDSVTHVVGAGTTFTTTKAGRLELVGNAQGMSDAFSGAVKVTVDIR